MSLFLTPDELHDLTDYRVPHLQARWLETNAYPFEMSRLGKPKVLRAYVEQRLGLASAAPLSHTEPDFSKWQH